MSGSLTHQNPPSDLQITSKGILSGFFARLPGTLAKDTITRLPDREVHARTQYGRNA